MAQMPIQLVAGRAQPFAPPPPAPSLTPPAGAGQAVDPGAIPAAKLRPGSIDQTTFRARMAALNRADSPSAGVTQPTAAKPLVASAPSAIPTLTPAQLAALGVDLGGVDGAALPAPPATVETVPDAAIPADQVAEPIQPQSTQAAPVLPEAEVELANAPETAPQPEAGAESAPEAEAPIGPMPGARLAADGVWELPRQPGKDERDWLKGMNARYRIVENPDSVRLFLGADGRFGFDDLLDIINPLQHIPLVNTAYRALTGDTVDGAAQLLGAIPFGPLSVVSNVTDLAFRAETGAGLAENGLAMLFGPAEGDIATASGSTAQLADASLVRRGSNR